MGVYSFIDVVAGLAGPGIAVSLASEAGVADEGISVEYNEDINTMRNGSDGEVMHSLHAARPGRVAVRLFKTSPLNAILSAAYKYQTSSAALHGRNTITVANKTSGDIGTCLKCAFKKHPALMYAKDGDIITWEFDVGKIDAAFGALNNG